MINRITPHILLTGAEKYLDAAKAVCTPPITEKEKLTCRASFPAYFLIGHSIELSLKAFLNARGVKPNRLRHNFGHDLSKLISECRRRKLGREVKLCPNHVKTITLLNRYYVQKVFEYAEVGTYTLPRYSDVYEIALRLVNELRSYCYKATFKKELPKTLK